MGVAGVLGLVFGSIAALFVLVVVGAAVIGGSSGRDTSTPLAYSTPSPYSEPTRSRADESDPPTPDDTPTVNPSPRPTEDDEPDDEPDVDPPEQVTVNRSLKNNSVYRAGALPRYTCRAGNVNLRSHSQVKSLILKTGKCMDRAWGEILRKQNIPFTPPDYAIVATKGRGVCGDYPPAGSNVPYYCPRNRTIYVSTSGVAVGNSSSAGYGQIINWHGGVTSAMAHEYGHHVQNLTGLIDSWWERTLETSSQSSKLGLSRRMELQATCFAGMWMRSVAASYPVSTSNRQRLFWLWSNLGDHPGRVRDHGSPANNHRWFRQGWEKNQAYQCNTWVVPASATS
ncbi:neutral zinc metallopeptidase [Nonomuraea sp. NPDC048826]|uniref:neutral zinc metallopeptidase n=1 Tax=Nonomuraea sp. NPDC048826 TaxID=3364347 RepID=UPI003717EC62